LCIARNISKEYNALEADSSWKKLPFMLHEGSVPYSKHPASRFSPEFIESFEIIIIIIFSATAHDGP
jgi:hypothetical protein